MANSIINKFDDKQMFLVRGEITDFVQKVKLDSDGDKAFVSPIVLMANNSSRPTVRYNSHTIRFKNQGEALGDKEWKLFDGILILLAELYEGQENISGVDIPVPLLKKFVGYRKIEDVHKHLEGLKSTQVQYRYFDRYHKINIPDFGPVPVILDYRLTQKNKVLNVTFSPEVERDLFGAAKYVFLDYKALKSFKSRYSRLLYKNLVQDQQELRKSKLSQRVYKIDDLKCHLDWPKKSWHKNHEFKTKIEDAIADINEYSDLYIWQYDFHQSGKEIKGVEFVSSLDLRKRHDTEKQIKGVETHNKDNISRDAIYKVCKLLQVPMHKSIFPTLFAAWHQAKKVGIVENLWGEVYERNRHKAFELYFDTEYKTYAANKGGVLKPIFEAAGKLVKVKFENSGTEKNKHYDLERQNMLKQKPDGMSDVDFLRLNGYYD